MLIEQVNPENARYISETQTDMWTFHNLNKPVLKKEKTRPPPPAQPILYTYAHWYCELATLKASSGHLCISMDGKTLLCRGTWSSSVDLYIDRNGKRRVRKEVKGTRKRSP